MADVTMTKMAEVTVTKVGEITITEITEVTMTELAEIGHMSIRITTNEIRQISRKQDGKHRAGNTETPWQP